MPVTDIAYDDYDSPIGEEANSGGFVILPPGVYPFTISEPIEREQFSGSAKMPACKKAIVKLDVDGGQFGNAKVFYNLFLTQGQSWKIKQLFVGVGLVDANAERFTPPWNQLPGASGVVEVKNREYNGNTYNDVAKILSPTEAAEAMGAAMLAGNAAPAAAPQTTFNYPKA